MEINVGTRKRTLSIEIDPEAIWNALLDLLFPPKCPFCGRLLSDSPICDACADALPWTDADIIPDNADSDSVPDNAADALVCVAPLYYEGAVRNALLAFKFEGKEASGDPFGRLVAQCASERLSGMFDTVTFVPISRERRRKRGYNQSQRIAESACRLWGVRPEGLLVKTADNPPQSGIGGAAARRANVSGVYALAPGHSAVGRRVLLVDDIRTTGATLRECAKVLRDGGAASVCCVTVAEVRPRKDAQT